MFEHSGQKNWAWTIVVLHWGQAPWPLGLNQCHCCLMSWMLTLNVATLGLTPCRLTINVIRFCRQENMSHVAYNNILFGLEENHQLTQKCGKSKPGACWHPLLAISLCGSWELETMTFRQLSLKFKTINSLGTCRTMHLGLNVSCQKDPIKAN